MLRRFADENGKLFCFNKVIADKGGLESAPADVFLEKHLCGAIEKDGSKDVSFERYYADLEGEASLLIDLTKAEQGALCRPFGRQPRSQPH